MRVEKDGRKQFLGILRAGLNVFDCFKTFFARNSCRIKNRFGFLCLRLGNKLRLVKQITRRAILLCSLVDRPAFLLRHVREQDAAWG
jgi:hypothetical protein